MARVRRFAGRLVAVTLLLAAEVWKTPLSCFAVPAQALSNLLREVQAAVRPGAYSPRAEEDGRRVAAAALAAEASAARRCWRNGDLELLNGTWELLFTSNGDVDRGDARRILGDAAAGFGDFQPLKLDSVRQEIDVQAGRLRNRLSLKPWPGYHRPWGRYSLSCRMQKSSSAWTIALRPTAMPASGSCWSGWIAPSGGAAGRSCRA
ncbi:unnamed protein product [Symbiodinium natans]|uniref:Plastid lipid-associated protein/fibrillin conserved domain-containing protein n=1 Tax=Symbiodinium natans TaxID=878477 RepID=A0A812Q933_9DINO|nr:unnamed protein product [Symbiodinium natans]